MQAHKGVIRLGLIALGLPQLLIGLWAIFDKQGWFDSFPGPFASDWLPAYGAFNEHLALDVGATFIAIGGAMLLAAVWMERRAVQVALVASSSTTSLTSSTTSVRTTPLPSGEQVASGVVLASTVVVAAALLALTRSRPTAARAAPAVSGNGAARISLRKSGMLARFGNWYARRQYGSEVTPGGVFAHHPKLAMGYGAMEMAVERSHSVDAKLKDLAAIRAAQIVNCEWCMDFGSKLGRGCRHHRRAIAREMAKYSESAAFDPLEKLVLDYATAASRSPAEVDDELFAKLAEHFDEAQLVELTTAIAIENFRARFNHATGIAAQGFSEGMVCVVPETTSAVPAATGLAAEPLQGFAQDWELALVLRAPGRLFGADHVGE